jgi:hypothetical protein
MTQARVNRSRYEWDEGNYEDEEKEMGALCFTRRVHRMQVPKGFKLPHDQQKYDGPQEPELGLSDYLQAVKILRGSRATAMQSLQLHLTSTARSWLSKVPDDSIGTWGELEDQFTRNFLSTYTRSASIEEVKSCIQKSGDMLCSYRQRWSVIKNSAKNNSDERAIDAFAFGLSRLNLVEELERIRPRTVLELMEVANRFTDGEDAYHKEHVHPSMIDQADIKIRGADLVMKTTASRATKYLQCKGGATKKEVSIRAESIIKKIIPEGTSPDTLIHQ